MTDIEDTTGLKALYLAALDSNVRFITAVAGYPMTAVADYFFENKDPSNYNDYNIHWFTNEKAALEAALGASVTGRRSIVMVKHVGMNVLSDPLMTAMMHTIGSGLVILAGDDPGARASQNEQDSRFYGALSETAVFDPSTPRDVYDSLKRAFELSEKAKVPVIMRITERIEKEKQEVCIPVSKPKINPEEKVLDRNIWKLTMHGKHQRFHIDSEPILIHEAESSRSNRMSINGDRVGIISSGYPSFVVDKILSTQLVYSSYSHLSLGMVSPFPEKLVKRFIEQHERIIVVEESEPFIESHISTCSEKVLGKKTGHLPFSIIEKEHVNLAFENIDKDEVSKYTDVQTILSRGSKPICSDCPFMPLYNVLSDIQPVAGDMGCSIRTAPDPLNAVNTGFALGGAISTACGFPGKGIAVIGDFGLAHSGIIGLINAVDSGFDILAIVLQNDVAAMTGGQAAPDLKEVVKTLVPDTTCINIDEMQGSEGSKACSDIIKDTIQKKLDQKGVSVIYIEGSCPKY
ncbi:thiamine pyrophosphate-dependent enzyme [Methanolobus bombayensis]|uniref:thiamine pyrophosphate-dependent enzyme n=1 Tax=Methanolobus bombayensis TaxID=38023 RepID=UPI001AE2555C|nr:thiamine pyrophosphate-dependent enzyme [Methanolobus bombayensis]MBP1908774.1 indolepyruvate ferredoxin oxidoreductase alpha subunit [Methanolobus bombayensis]